MRKSRSRNTLDLWQCSHLGLVLAIFTGLGAYGGYRLDAWLDIAPTALVLGTLAGLAGGMWHLLRTVAALSGKDGDDEPA